MHMLPVTVISSASNTYAKKPKRLGIGQLPLRRLEMVISTYSNTLLSVSMINISNLACERAAEYGHLDCLKYLRETAKAPWDEDAVRLRAREQPPRLCTIPPRQQLSITKRLAIRRRSTTHARVVVVVIIIIIIIVIIIIVVEKQTQTREETFVLKKASKISLKPSDLSSSDRIQSSAFFSLFAFLSRVLKKRKPYHRYEERRNARFSVVYLLRALRRDVKRGDRRRVRPQGTGNT